MRRVNVFLLLVSVLFFVGGCNSQKPVENIDRHGVINLNEETIKELEKGILLGTPIRFDQEITMKDIEEVWGKPDEHFDYEDIQTYVYIKNGQKFLIDEDEMKSIYMVQVELDYTKDEILSLMGTPTHPGNIFQYEKGDYLIQFEKYDEKWRLIVMKRYY
jgi:hypothetical protein